MNDDELIEALAAYAHEAWSGWMVYLFSQGNQRLRTIDGESSVVFELPAWAVERWQRQLKTPYADLPEAEKRSDRVEAAKMLAIVRRYKRA